MLGPEKSEHRAAQHMEGVRLDLFCANHPPLIGGKWNA